MDVCFLCGRPPTFANPVSGGNFEELRACWLRCSGLCASIESKLRWPDGASNHSHCRAIIRAMLPAGSEKQVNLDAMIRCYPLCKCVIS
jgi:hypothetical protein